MTTAFPIEPRSVRRHFTAIRSLVAILLAAALATACGSSGTTLTTPTTSVRCGVTTTASASTLGSAGGTATIAVTTERECQWTATSDNAWLKVMAGSSGQGPGTVELAASANVNPSARTAAVVVNDQRIDVTQAAADCGIELSNASASISASGGSGSVDVRASSAACPWTASSDVSWIAITSGGSGTGSGTVTFDVSAATGGARSGTLKIAGQSFVVNQTEGCSYQITPATFAASAAGGETPVMVSTGHDCAWSAASTASWISLSPASGTGTASVSVSVAPAAGAARTGTATIAGQTFTVSQSQACTVTISAASASVGAAGGTGRIDVSAGAACAWAAASSAGWLSVTSGASGTGNGAVDYTAAANAGPARTATISVAARTLTITQAGGCTVSLASSAQSVTSGGATVSIGVSAAAGCAWSATSTVSWIAIAAGAAGSGNGVVQLDVAANAGGERMGTVTIGGQTFTVTQSGACAYSLSSTSQQVPASGGSGTFTVTAAGGCAWTAAPSAGWISLTSANGTGSGTVKFTAAANTGAARSATIAVEGQTFTLTQDGACTASIAPDTITVDADATSRSVQITTPAGCAWTASSGTPWISVSSGSGSGAAAVEVAIAANTGAARTGTATIAGRTVTVTQAAAAVCTFTISPSQVDIGKGDAKGTVSVRAADGCAWIARSNASWITITSGASDSGNGSVKYSVEKNPKDGPARTGTLTIAGEVFTVKQKEG